MTRLSFECGISAVLLCLAFASVHAEDAAEPKPSQPPATQDQQDQKEQTKPKPKEEAANPGEPNSNASKEEPECK